MASKKKKSSAKLYKYLDSDKELFKDVVFLVEATHHEQFGFWQQYFYKPYYDNCKVEDWEQITKGRWVQIGELDGRPVAVSINWALLEGYKVMFYEGISQVVDHAMIEKWIKHFSEDITWDNGHRWAHTDSSNFHHCLHAIQELVKKKGKGPGRKR